MPAAEMKHFSFFSSDKIVINNFSVLLFHITFSSKQNFHLL